MPALGLNLTSRTSKATALRNPSGPGLGSSRLPLWASAALSSVAKWPLFHLFLSCSWLLWTLLG